jgi:hypothetical protein
MTKTFCNQPCLESLNLPIYTSLPLIDTFTPYEFIAIRRLFKFLDLVGIHGFQICFHSLDKTVDIRIIKSFPVGPQI